jgi:hypothetical protein
MRGENNFFFKLNICTVTHTNRSSTVTGISGSYPALGMNELMLFIVLLSFGLEYSGRSLLLSILLRMLLKRLSLNQIIYQLLAELYPSLFSQG